MLAGFKLAELWAALAAAGVPFASRLGFYEHPPEDQFRKLRSALGKPVDAATGPVPPQVNTARTREVVVSDVIIVGGGVMGAATFFELAQRGVDVRLLERDRFAGASSGKSAAIVRMHYSNPSVVRMALRSRRIFASFPDITGASAGYRAGGWTFLVPAEDETAVRETFAMNRRRRRRRRRGPARRARLPSSRASTSPDIALALHEPRSGLRRSPHDGGGLHRGGPAARWEGRRRRPGPRDRPSARSGCGSRHPRRARGLRDGRARRRGLVGQARPLRRARLGYRVTREEELYVELPGGGPGGGSVSSVVDRVYLRPLPEAAGGRGDVYLVGRGFPKDYQEVDPDAVDYSADDGFAADLIERLSNRFSAFKLGRIVGGTVGLYEVTPDWHPYLGEVDGVDGLVLATGGSGHGFKLAPAIGEMVAEAVTSSGRVIPCSPIEAFEVQRFARGRAVRGRDRRQSRLDRAGGAGWSEPKSSAGPWRGEVRRRGHSPAFAPCRPD